LPWHQDRWSWLDRDPLLTAYTAIDAATIATGCVELMPGTQGHVINPSDPSAYLTDEQAAEHCPDDAALPLELEAGEVVLLHNWLAHRSGVNRTGAPRRAFSVCYMDARTNDPLERHPIVFDDAGRPTNS
jgi:ectoine hydroxylase-related dioxygenase (phytanoyl-CoA dioxygenase family)